ncbi:hypothetical protein [Streptomyces morookaense]|uniref:Uncharacterized protein n=1 Tax=Streptomyces morookaense TaxID=1970 RepID=A0A7Y7EA00_STRMO|nr:hypothetical protein [Streptomyces morookaense]NVK80956.1 hypothetical protein [Streptomyces morookaense]GHF40800.1 hypothetical protein GCM10010359_49270 [Streptomyces morookaense]
MTKETNTEEPKRNPAITALSLLGLLAMCGLLTYMAWFTEWGRSPELLGKWLTAKYALKAAVFAPVGIVGLVAWFRSRRNRP